MFWRSSFHFYNFSLYINFTPSKKIIILMLELSSKSHCLLYKSFDRNWTFWMQLIICNMPFFFVYNIKRLINLRSHNIILIWAMFAKCIYNTYAKNRQWGILLKWVNKENYIYIYFLTIYTYIYC